MSVTEVTIHSREKRVCGWKLDLLNSRQAVNLERCSKQLERYVSREPQERAGARGIQVYRGIHD